MTIIQPNKNNRKINLLISGLVMMTVIVAIFGIFIYNQLINLRHEVIKQENNLKNIEVTNAELKNNFYQMIDNENLKVSVKEKNLVLEKNPQYVKNKTLVASH